MNWQIYGRSANTAANKLTWVLFIIYMLALFWILVLKLGVQFSYMGNREVNFMPFREQLMGEIIMNVVVFVPLGIYVGVLLDSWQFRKKLFFFFSVSLLVEAIQFIMAVGAFDITDIITNTSGGIMGFMLYRAIEKVCTSNTQSQKFINIIAATGTGCMIVLLVLLKLDMLPIRYR